MKTRSVLLITIFLLLFPLCAMAASWHTSGDYQYDVESNGTVSIRKYTGSAKELTVPAELDGRKVARIGYEAFKRCDTLTSVVLPEGIQNIGDSAFRNCTKLASVSLPDSLKDIGEDVFKMCGALTSVTLPANLIRIGNSAFEDCVALTSVHIMGTDLSFERSLFRGCNRLKEITVSPHHRELEVKDGVLFHKEKKILLCFPGGLEKGEYAIPDGTRSIGAYAFSGCRNLKTVTIPDSVTLIDSGAFENCSALKSATIPGSVKEIRSGAFEGCRALSGEVVIPDGTTEIGYSTFEGCASLTGVTIPGSVTDIRSSAFKNCSSLRHVYFPASVREISDDAFEGCGRLHPAFEPDSAAERYFQGFGKKRIMWRFPWLQHFCVIMGILGFVLAFKAEKNHQRYLSRYRQYGKWIGMAACLMGLLPILFILFLVPENNGRVYLGQDRMGFALIGSIIGFMAICVGMILLFRRGKKPVRVNKEVKEEDLRSCFEAAAGVLENAKKTFSVHLQSLQGNLQNEKHIKLKSGLKAACQVLGGAVKNAVISSSTGIDPIYLDNDFTNLGDIRLRAVAALKELISACERSKEKLSSPDPKVKACAEQALMMYCRDTDNIPGGDYAVLKQGGDLYSFMACYLDTLSIRRKIQSVQMFAKTGLEYGRALRDAAEGFMNEYPEGSRD